MICPYCGSQLRDGSKFCTNCGGDVSAAPAPAPDPVPVPEPASAPAPDQQPAPRRRGRAALIAVIVVSLAVIVVAGVLIALHLTGSRDVPTLTFGSREAVSVSRVTRIVPSSAEGSPLQRYVVRVREAFGPDGSRLDVSALPRLDVDGETGFTMADLGELDEGTYEVTVTPDDGAPQYIPPVSVVDGDPGDAAGDGSGDGSEPVELPEEIVVVPPEDPDGSGGDLSAPVRLGRYGAYLSKVRELREAHGELTVVSLSGSDVSWLAGLCFVRLVDFGDGAERLVVTCAKPEAMSEPPQDLDVYTVEVWGYDEGSDQAVLEWSGGTSNTPGGHFFVCFWHPGDGSGVNLTREVPDTYFTVVGILEDGTLGVEHEFEQTYFQPDGSVSLKSKIDGQPVENEAFSQSIAELGYESRETYFLLSSAGASSTGSVDDAVGITQETVERLEQAAGDIADAAGQAGGTQPGGGDAGQGESEQVQPVDPATLTYSGEEVTATESVPAYNNGDGSPSGTLQRTWGYLRFSASGEGSAVDEVNALLKADYDGELAASQVWTLEAGKVECLRQRSSLDYLSGSVAGYRIYRDVTQWGAHGGTEIEGYVVDLATGAQMEPWEALGVDRAQLDATAAEVLRSYVLSRPDALYVEDTLDGSIAEYVAQDNYMLTRDGITVYLGDYDFFSYASGTHEVLVWPTGDKTAGTDVTGDYAFPYDE